MGLCAVLELARRPSCAKLNKCTISATIYEPIGPTSQGVDGAALLCLDSYGLPECLRPLEPKHLWLICPIQ